MSNDKSCDNCGKAEFCEYENGECYGLDCIPTKWAPKQCDRRARQITGGGKMSGFKHTKGPWGVLIYTPINKLLEEHYIAIESKYDMINEKSELICKCTKQANASLIAAAPEMRDALIHQYRWVKSLYDLYRIDERAHHDSDLIKTERDLRELIERATGLTIDEAIKAWEAEHK